LVSDPNSDYVMVTLGSVKEAKVLRILKFISSYLVFID